MDNVISLEKRINKTPLLCKLGLHRWRVVKILPSLVTDAEYHTERCTKCPAEHTRLVA